MVKPRDYKKEYEWQGTPEQIHKRSLRNQARKKVIAKLGKAAVLGKDVDHKRPLKNGGGNGISNLRVQSISVNRSRKT